VLNFVDYVYVDFIFISHFDSYYISFSTLVHADFLLVGRLGFGLGIFVLLMLNCYFAWLVLRLAS